MKTIKITLPNPCDKEGEIVRAIYSIQELYVSDEEREGEYISLTVPYTKIEQLLHVFSSVVNYSESGHYTIGIR